jgi:predicted cupin superfamily sugar epimerase
MKRGMNAGDIIAALNLEPHPKEGGFFREVYRAREPISHDALPSRYDAERCHSTAIYYLLTPDTFSHLHTVNSDEVFHFYLGDPVEMLQLYPDGTGHRVALGSDIAAGQTPMTVVPQGVWQGCRLRDGGAYALMGCTVAPGFEYADYAHGGRMELTAAYPQFASEIAALTNP